MVSNDVSESFFSMLSLLRTYKETVGKYMASSNK